MVSYNLDGSVRTEEQKKEMKRLTTRRFYEKNKEKCNNYSKEYYQKNKERMASMAKQAYLIRTYLSNEDIEKVMEAVKD